MKPALKENRIAAHGNPTPIPQRTQTMKPTKRNTPRRTPLGLAVWLFLLLVNLPAWAILGTPISQNQGSDWPGWLGPNRDGISTETGLLSRIPKGGLIPVWSATLGEGFSGVSVADGKVITMHAQAREYAICFDSENGQKLWQTAIGKRFESEQGGNGPRATPVIDKTLVFFTGAQGNITALDKNDGSLVWRKSLIEDFQGNLPVWGYCGSPVVEGDLLLLESGATEAPSILALEKKTGDVVWRARPGKAGYTAPLVATVAHIRQGVFFTGSGPVGVQLSTGKVLWEHPWETPWEINAATPIKVSANEIFISSNYGRGGSLLRIEKDTDGFKARPVWQKNVMSNHFSTSVLYRGFLYGFDNAVLKCVRAEDGVEFWQKRGFGKGSLIIAEGKLIIMADHGVLVLAKAQETEFVDLGRFHALKGKCWTVPTLAQGNLYLRNKSSLVCFKMKGQNVLRD